MNDDDLFPAKGCLLGVLVGIIVWVAFGVLIYVVTR